MLFLDVSMGWLSSVVDRHEASRKCADICCCFQIRYDDSTLDSCTGRIDTPPEHLRDETKGKEKSYTFQLEREMGDECRCPCLLPIT